MNGRVRPRPPWARRRGSARRIAATALAVVVVDSLTGCALTVPADPQGTFDRIQGGILRAGASVEPGLVSVIHGEVSGPLTELVERFATRNQADVEWTVGGEETLLTDLEAGDLDLVIGGTTSDTPWTDRAGVSRAYRHLPSTGEREVVLIPLGIGLWWLDGVAALFISPVRKLPDETTR